MLTCLASHVVPWVRVSFPVTIILKARWVQVTRLVEPWSRPGLVRISPRSIFAALLHEKKKADLIPYISRTLIYIGSTFLSLYALLIYPMETTHRQPPQLSIPGRQHATTFRPSIGSQHCALRPEPETQSRPEDARRSRRCRVATLCVSQPKKEVSKSPRSYICSFVLRYLRHLGHDGLGFADRPEFIGSFRRESRPLTTFSVPWPLPQKKVAFADIISRKMLALDDRRCKCRQQ